MDADQREIISPVKLPAKGEGVNRLEARRRYTGRAVALMVILMAILAGVGLLWQKLVPSPVHVDAIPGETTTPESASAPSRVETVTPREAPIPVASGAPSQRAEDMREAENPPADLWRATPEPTGNRETETSSETLRRDPASPAIQTPVAQLQQTTTEAQFRQLMSAGLAAYHDHNYVRARDQLVKAQVFKPNSPEVQEALAQVDQAMQLARIAELRQEALAAEQSEAWEQALQMYTAVLHLDPALQFAIQGQARSRERLRIAKHMQVYLDKPQVLASDGHLASAVQLLDDATRIEPKGPRLVVLIDKLEHVVTRAKTPVPVILESDKLTDVAVYKVGKLGRFDRLQLRLRPGTYTVVGSRNGYKDVRQTIVVQAEQKSVRVTVQCREKI